MAVTRKKEDWNLDSMQVSFLSKKVEEGIKLRKQGSLIPEKEVDSLMRGSATIEKPKHKRKIVSDDDDSFENYLTSGSSRKVTPSAAKESYVPCHQSHPPLPIPVGNKVYEIYGGSCHNPKIKDMDVFVGLDSGMVRTSRQYPWHEGTEFQFLIQDMGVPKDVEEFKKLLNYLKESLEAGKKVFVGCIGGHGRTGTVFSALVKLMSNIEDSTTYVREHYCKRIVESSTQVDWLHTHFGIKKVEGTKEKYVSSKPSYKSTDWSWDSDAYSTTRATKKAANGYAKTTDFCTKSDPMPKSTRIVPVACDFTIHGDNKVQRV